MTCALERAPLTYLYPDKYKHVFEALMVLGKKQSVIMVPPATKRRAERLSKWYGRSITYFIETAAPRYEIGILNRLPDDPCRDLYLKQRLTFERAFPDKTWRRRWTFPDPAEGPHEALSVLLSPKARRQFKRWRTLMKVPAMSVLVARIFKSLERQTLEQLNDEERAQYFSGQRERQILPDAVDPFEDEDDEDE
jgi:hypothetical protein